jgi:hypothetical protein
LLSSKIGEISQPGLECAPITSEKTITGAGVIGDEDEGGSSNGAEGIDPG